MAQRLVDGVAVGRELQPGLYCETIGAGRYVIRSKTGPEGLTRRGEVFGSGRTFSACTMRGALVSQESSLLAAARALLP